MRIEADGRISMPLWVASVAVGLYLGFWVGLVSYFWFPRDWIR